MSKHIQNVIKGYPNHKVIWEIRRYGSLQLRITIFDLENADKDGFCGKFEWIGEYYPYSKIKYIHIPMMSYEKNV